jgi:hypothetical protein
MRAVVAAAVAALFIPGIAHAWEPEGHDVIATATYDSLSEAQKAKFNAILAGGDGLQVDYTDSQGKEHSCHARTLDQLANWPDCVRYGGDYAATYGDHFNDIPFCPKPPNAQSPASACDGDTCATKFLAVQVAALKAPGTSAFDRAAALAFVVHIVGDMHQPLHMIDNHDKGGNDIRAVLNGRKTKLHTIWDGDIVTAAYHSAADATKGTETLAKQHAGQWSHSSPTPSDYDIWAAESHAIAVEAYDAVKPALMCGTTDKEEHEITPAYLDQFTPAVRDQLAKAALRLSDVLKDALAN